MSDILKPVFPTSPTGSGTPISCSLVMIDQFNPINYTPTGDGTQLCQHLAGLDAALAIIDNSLENLDGDDVIVSSITPSYYFPQTTTLPSFLSAIDVQFGKINTTLPRDFGAQLFPDGDSGKFNANITNMSATGVTLAQDNSVFHDPTAGSSLKNTSTSTADKTITHTDAIAFLVDQEYELSAYVFVPASSYPDAAVVSMTVTAGTGIIRKTKILTVSGGGTGRWTKISTRFIPDQNQARSIAISVTGFTNATILYIDDVSVSEVPGKRLGYLAPYSIVSLTNLAALYNRMATSFVRKGGTITTDAGSMNVVVADSEYVLNGRVYWRNSETIVATPNRSNYIFYNSFNDQYVIKTVIADATPPLADEGEIVIAYVATNFVGATASADLTVKAPYNGSFLQPASITTALLQDNSVTDNKLVATGVAAASYIFSNLTVNNKGRITAAASGVVLTSVYTNNLLAYNSGTGKFVNVSAPIFDNNPATLADNSVLNSTAVTLRGYYDSDAGAGITATSYDAFLQHVMTNTSPLSKLHFNIGGTAFLKYSSKGWLELLNSTSGPLSITGGNVLFSQNVTINAVTKSALSVMNEFGDLITLVKANTYVLTYNTANRTLNAYTSNNQNVAYTGQDNAQAGAVYAKLDDLNALRVAYQNLKTSYDNLIQVLVAMNVDLKTVGLIG